ncbi:hypothetical protein SAMN02910417_01205 [Eubacterium oxidoreducens]|uniref:DUF2225 domain-containing protein n=2 Tax=Eubacterium oxidoreducens TaxID=1732 RepID=A0A1G6B5N0_EUBOX|nr:hypothetical protein SAMN02910417_01205 [Eubacterium oxidoreducens]
MSEGITPQEKETQYIFDKKYTCPCCDKEFISKTLKSGRVRRDESDMDLRPKAKGIDILKYQVIMCPNCGYSTLAQNYGHLSSLQIKLIREKVSESFRPRPVAKTPIVTYDMALDAYIHAIKCSEARLGKQSEKAYLSLIVHWILDSKAEMEENADMKNMFLEKSEIFYRSAYDGFVKAIAEEYFPMAGMDETTIDYLVAYMAFHFGQLEVASKLLSQVLTNQMAPRRLKDRALELKDRIIDQIKNGK